jgi:TrmH family RNA methyltransferase
VTLARRPVHDLTSLLDRSRPLLLVACDIQDPGNVGALLRAAEAGGATGAVFCGSSADPYGWKALRGSMGSALRLPLSGRGDLRDVMAETRAHGIRLLATVPRDGTSLYDADLTGPVALVLGGEGPGLTGEALALADERVMIPMRPPVESLNVAVAAAVFVFEAARQRGSWDSKARRETRGVRA